MIHNEQLLQYLWKYKLYAPSSFVTSDRRAVEVIDPGVHNKDAGPDFFNAKVRINGQVWAGNVEIHVSSDDWYGHRHHLDKAYNSVILHVAEKVTAEVVNEAGQVVPQCALLVSERVRENAHFLLHSDTNLPCRHHLYSLPKVLVHSFLSRLSIERLERKSADVSALLARFKHSWDDAFYVMLCRNFGFGVNADAFERLALSLPFRVLLRHTDSLATLEALLFGQAGFLNEPIEGDAYHASLRSEYLFLKAKYALKELDAFLFRRLRIRPRSFPEVRIAQFASLLHASGRLFSVMLHEEDYNGVINRFLIEPSAYWQTHYAFGRESSLSSKKMGVSSLEIIVINTIVPLLFAYGKSVDDEMYGERALRFLEMVKPEKNRIVQEFREAGVVPENACDSQALVQLRREYCEKRECLTCRFGHALLARAQTGGGESSETN